MRRFNSRTCMALGLAGVVLVSACATEPPTGPTIAVTVSPATVSVQAGGSQDFTATVTNDPAAKGVTWSITGCSGGATVCGSVTNVTGTTATYTAPAPVPSDAHLGITAISVADNTKSSSATVAITAISVSVSPTSASVPANGSQLFTATVANDPTNSGVTWSITSCSGGPTICGSLTNVADTTATFTAPASVPPGGLAVRATSIADGTKSSTASVAVTAGGAGGRIVFVRSDSCGSYAVTSIYAMNSDGSGVKRLANAKNMYGACIGLDLHNPTWSHDGMKIALDGTWGGVDVYVMNADGSQPRHLNVYDREPTWSPDGTRLAATGVVGLLHPLQAVETLALEGSGTVVLAVGGHSPAWSPDGQHIAFVLGNSTRSEVRVMNADGSGVTSLAEGFSPSWSPDGTKIAFERNGGIYVMNADGSGVSLLITDLRNVGRSTWSPDGLQIAFGSDRDGTGAIYVMNADGSGVKRLTDGGEPSWGPP